MKNFFESPQHAKKGNNLTEELEKFGVDAYVLEKYQDLINKIEFKNINIFAAENEIHLKMAAALFSRQEKNNKTFFKNIIQQVELEEVDKIDIMDYSTLNDDEDGEDLFNTLDMENIDLNIGTNRRVDKIDCLLKNGKNITFTLSADLNNAGEQESNSFQEKLVFESEIAQDNLVLQKFYGYFEKDFKGIDNRFIAKEYLPGDNISHYLNKLQNSEQLFHEFLNVSSELGYSMAYMYNKCAGQLLSDLKLENMIYNHINTDEVEYACRICDNSGAYSERAEEKSVSQILAQLQSLLAIFHNKQILFNKQAQTKSDNITQEDLVESYLDSFVTNLTPESLNVFRINIKKINQGVEGEIFEIDQDLKDYVLNYIND
jgi:hypothetical protein